jgi:hypothetical protein
MGCFHDKGSNNQPKDAICPITNGHPALIESKIRIDDDYDRIYLPSNESGVSLARYNELEIYAASVDERQHQRLTRPSHPKLMDADVENQLPTLSNRNDRWIGNMSQDVKEDTKISGPPTKKPPRQSSRRDSWIGNIPRAAMAEKK